MKSEEKGKEEANKKKGREEREGEKGQEHIYLHIEIRRIIEHRPDVLRLSLHVHLLNLTRLQRVRISRLSLSISRSANGGRFLALFALAIGERGLERGLGRLERGSGELGNGGSCGRHNGSYSGFRVQGCRYVGSLSFEFFEEREGGNFGLGWLKV